MLALFAQVALVQLWLSDHEVTQVYGLQPHHLLICDALGLEPRVVCSTRSAQNRSVQSESLNVGCLTKPTLAEGQRPCGHRAGPARRMAAGAGAEGGTLGSHFR